MTVAAQRVQRSAYPDAYADDEALARRLVGLPAGAVARPATLTTTAADCASTPVAAGSVEFPLPAGSGYVDNHNWGGHGSHWARFHTGTDLSVACGTPVLAATSGTVVVRTDQSWAGRWLVQVSTGVGRLTTWYAHMRAVDVTAGQTVSAGQRLGEVGDLGNATGCHLHFEVHPQGGSIYRDSVDPTPWLRANVGRSAPSTAPASWARSEEAFTLATFNTLGSSHTTSRGKHPGMASGSARTRGVVDLLERYGVDVVGLQEFQGSQHRAFRRLAGSTYATWSPAGDTENSLAWRRDRWELERATSLAIPYFDGHRRRMPVVTLRDRVTSKVTVFVNVHNPADTRAYPRQARWRAAAVAREAALVERVTRSTGHPVVVTGDMNDRRDVFCRLAAAGMTASNGGSAEPCAPPAKAGIDWILATDGVGFSDHTVDRGALVRDTSDHPFVVTRVLVP